MNASTLIVRIISVPQPVVFPGNLLLVKMQVEFAKGRQGKQKFGQFEISIWGSLGSHLLQYYAPGDYIIIEGILSLRKRKMGNLYQKDTKFAVTNFYPFLLSEGESEV